MTSQRKQKLIILLFYLQLMYELSLIGLNQIKFADKRTTLWHKDILISSEGLIEIHWNETTIF